MFLNFNYTDTLQLLYRIPDSQVLHIHGQKKCQKVFGHNECFSEPLPTSNLTQEDYDHGIEVDWRIEEAKTILNNIPLLFYKDSSSIINANSAFFDAIKNYEEIIFMGWSLGNQDEMYMNEILFNLSEHTKIYVVYFDSDTVKRYENYFERHGYFKKRATYYHWQEVSKLFAVKN